MGKLSHKARRVRRGRRGPKRDKSVARTFTAAATILGYSVSHIKAIRDAGCPGFHANGRISTAEVKAWMLANPDKLPAPTHWRDALGQEKLRGEKRTNDYEEGLLVRKSAVAERLQKLFRPALARVEQMLINEYPSKVAGLDVPAARVYGKRVLDLVIEAHREAATQWQT